MSAVRIALFQARTGIDPSANAQALKDAVREAADGGAAILFTPEMSGVLDRNLERLRGSVRTESDDEVLAAARDAAKAAGIWVHLGSLAVRVAQGEMLANRSFVIDPDGEIRARYDKMHLFDVDLPTGESWRESASYHGGEQAVAVANTPLGMLGLTICYDLRFSELFARLAEAGASAIAVPAAFTVPTGIAHWEVLVRARAIEAGLFVIAAAQCGDHEDGRATYGHSMVVDPWGRVLLDAGTAHGTHLVDVDPGQVAEVRSRIPAIRHRRPVPLAVIN